MLKSALALALSLVALSGCYSIASNYGGGGGGLADEQGVYSDNEPTDDNGTDELGTHHHPRYHPRKHPARATNDHATGVAGSSSSSSGTP